MNLSKRNILSIIVTSGVVLFLSITDASCDELWSRAFMGTPSSGPFRPFNVVILESVTGNHLMATCSFSNYSDESDSPPSVTIQGVKKDGKFYPHVFVKVTNDVNGEWKTIGELGVPGKPASRKIAAKSVDDSLTVQLDVFRPLIGTFVYGSVVLPTGEAAVFELNDLLPPGQEAETRNKLTAGNSNDSVARTPGTSLTAGAADRKALDETIRMLSKEQAQLKYDVKEIPACVLQGLGRWTQTRFVIINWNQSFPPVEDISHTGDGQYRMLFFARLSPDKTLLCFQNNTGVGAAYHGLVFVRQNETCDMIYQFAFEDPVWSMKDLRSAIIENAKYQLDGDR